MLLQTMIGGKGSGSRGRRSRNARRRSARGKLWAFRPACERMEDRTLLATMLWSNAAGGDWDLASNWVNSGDSTDHHVPIATDDAIIDLDGVSVTHVQGNTDSVNSLSITSTTDSLSLSNGSLAIAAASSISGSLAISGGTFDYSGSNALSTGTLTQTGGTLTGTGTVNVSGLTTWTNGTMSGTGATVADGGLAIGGTAAANYFEYLSGRELDNYGAATLNAYAPYGNGFYFSGGAVLDNEASGTLAIGTDTSIYANSGTPSDGTFVNQGTLSKTGGTGTSVVAVTFNDTGAGTVQVSSGVISLQGTTTVSSTGALSAAASTVLGFDAGTASLGDGTTFSGAGTVAVRGGTFTIPTGTVTSAAAFALSGGTINGAGTLTLDGALTWNGGTMSGTGTTIANGTMAIGGTAAANYFEYLSGRELDNYGAATFNAYAPYGNGFYVSGGAVLDNEAGATLAFGSDTSIYANSGTPSDGTFVNQGTLSKTGGTGTSAITLPITDTGTVQASSGTLSLQGGGTVSGAVTLSASAGATLDFGVGTFTATAGSSIVGTGSGTVSFTGATVTVNGTYSVAGTTYVSSGEVDFDSTAATALLTEVGGTLGGTGTLTVWGQTTWTNGTMSGTGATVADGGLAIGGTAAANYFEYLSGRELDNYGAATFNAYAPYGNGFYVSGGAVLDNEAGATLAFGSDTSIYANSGTPSDGTFVNQGTLSKTGGTGTSAITLPITDTGTVQASSGTLSLQGGGTVSGAVTLSASAGATLDFGVGTFTATAGSSIVGTGSGTVSFTGATVTVNGTYSVAGTTYVSSGEVDFDSTAATALLTEVGGTLGGTGTLTVWGQTTWTNGTMSGTGATVADGGLAIGGTAAANYFEYLSGRELDNYGAATFNAYAPYGNGFYVSGGAVLDNEAGATLAFGSDTSIYANSGTPSDGTFVNQGTLSKTGGTGTSAIILPVTDTGNGSVSVQTGSLSINGGLSLASLGYLTTATTATLILNGGLTGTTINTSLYQPLGLLTIQGPGSASSPQLLEVMSQDLGTDPAGFEGNFHYGTIALANNAYVQLVDQAQNSAGSTGPEALYVDSLEVPAGTTLDLNGLHVYTRESQIDGTVINGTINQVVSGGPIAFGQPVSGTIATVGQVDSWTFFGRAGSGATVLVNPGDASAPAALIPYIENAQVSLIDPNGNVLATESDASPGDLLTLLRVSLPVDGVYTIQVQAEASQPSSTGHYELTVYDVEPTMALTASIPGPTYGQSLTFTITVSAASSGSPTPTGTVQFLVDGANFGSPVPLVNGVATSQATSALSATQHTISVSYSGDPDFVASTTSIQLVVAPTVLAVTADNQSTNYGDAVPALRNRRHVQRRPGDHRHVVERR